MLQRLHLHNFQIHEDLQLDLDPLITTVVGPSDVGKSAVIRALRWLATNRPSGDGFVRHGSKGASVTLEVDGRTIIRSKGGDNSYQLDDETYRAFGNEVPGDVATLLNLGDANIQSQHSSPFWFFETPGQVAQQLNKIINLDLIDRALGKAATGVRQARATAEASSTRLQEAKAKAAELAWVQAMASDLAEVEELYTSMQYTGQQCLESARLLEDRVKYGSAAQVAGDAKCAAANVCSLAREQVQVGQQVTELETLLNNRILSVQAWHTARDHARSANDDLYRLTVDRCPVCGQKVIPSNTK